MAVIGGGVGSWEDAPDVQPTTSAAMQSKIRREVTCLNDI
jgi:hypothetical protein